MLGNLIKNNICSKILKNPVDILSKIPNGSKILVGGFGLCGIPENSLRQLRELGTKNLTVVSNDAGNNCNLLINHDLGNITLGLGSLI